MNAIQPGCTELNVLHCLAQSELIVNRVLNRAQPGDGGISIEERREMTQQLAVVEGVLDYLHVHVLPSLLSGDPEQSQPFRSSALTLLAHIKAQLDWVINQQRTARSRVLN